VAKSPPRIYLNDDLAKRLVKLAGKIDGLPTVLANSFVDDAQSHRGQSIHSAESASGASRSAQRQCCSGPAQEIHHPAFPESEAVTINHHQL